MSTTWILAVCDQTLSSSFSPAFLNVQTSRTSSSMMEPRASSDFVASDQVEVHREAHLVLNRKSRCWGMAHVSPQLFGHTPASSSVSSQLASRAASAWPSGTRTPSAHFCGQTQDHWGDHAHSCVCGGNAVRDVVHNVTRGCCSLPMMPCACCLVTPHVE